MGMLPTCLFRLTSRSSYMPLQAVECVQSGLPQYSKQWAVSLLTVLQACLPSKCCAPKVFGLCSFSGLCYYVLLWISPLQHPDTHSFHKADTQTHTKDAQVSPPGLVCPLWPMVSIFQLSASCIQRNRALFFVNKQDCTTGTAVTEQDPEY